MRIADAKWEKNLRVSGNWFGFTSDRIKKWHTFSTAHIEWQLTDNEKPLLFNTQAQVKPFYTAYFNLRSKAAIFQHHLSFPICHYAFNTCIYSQADIVQSVDSLATLSMVHFSTLLNSKLNKPFFSSRKCNAKCLFLRVRFAYWPWDDRS